MVISGEILYSVKPDNKIGIPSKHAASQRKSGDYMSICELLFQWATCSTIKIQLSVCVYL
jgi:hypothetical protein